MSMEDDDDLAAALAMSKAEDPEVARCAKALLAVPKVRRGDSCLVTLKLLKNLSADPTNNKFRSVRLGNAKIKAAIVDVPEAKALMLACGFKEEADMFLAGDGAETKAQEAVSILEEATAPFVLSLELVGHAGAVRSICALMDGSIATGAMDNVVRIFPSYGGPPRCLVGHERFVGVDGVLAVCSRDADTIVSSGRDGRIIIWDITTGSKHSELTGHGVGVEVTNGRTIGALATLSDGTIVSGGWDKTCRVWSSPPQMLCGHQVAVNGVCVLDDGNVVTASGDGTLCMWSNGALVHTCSAGSPARAICAVDTFSVKFASAHNDGRVRTWGAAGAAIQSAVASGSYLFTVACIPSRDLLATGGDDGAVKLWSLTLELSQSILHPMEVFGVCFTPSGDLLTACGDGAARVWCRDQKRAAPAYVLEEFNSKIAAVTVATESAPAGSQAAPSGSWDFEFPVELTGGKKMSLHWNRGESTQDVANRFLQENELGANHMPDVMVFVQQAQSQAFAGGGNAGSRGQTHSYPVEVADGRRLTITWTHGEDPVVVAQRFAVQNMIGSTEVPDIAAFVAQVQGSASSPPATTPAASQPIVLSDEMVAMVVSMGFEEGLARSALQATGGNVELAIARLVGS